MAVIELAKSGLEATTYELVVSVGNSALMVAGVLSTQFLIAVGGLPCTDSDPNSCPSDTVSLENTSDYKETNGPRKYSDYTFLLIGFQILGALLFVPFLPASRQECSDWKRIGEERGDSETRAYLCLGLASVIIFYGILGTVLLLDEKTSCMQWIGGEGC